MFFRKKSDNTNKPPAVQPAYMVHPAVIERSELAQIIVKKGLFDIDSPENVLFLPADVELSRVTKTTLHADICEPLVEKQIELLDFLGKKEFKGRPLIDGVKSDDPDAIQEAKAQLDDVRDFTAMNIINGKLKINENDPNW